MAKRSKKNGKANVKGTTKTSKIKVLAEEKRQFSTGAKRQASRGKGMPVLVSPIVEDMLAKHCEGGVEAGYPPRNWEQGLPLSETMNSIKRHTRGEQEGLTDENHGIAASWNWMVYLHTKEMIRRGLLPEELDDMPNYIPKECPKHPKYKAKRKPTGDCYICHMIWENKHE
jgi:hypothetical protein